jgi:hypothetical protein
MFTPSLGNLGTTDREQAQVKGLDFPLAFARQFAFFQVGHCSEWNFDTFAGWYSPNESLLSIRPVS